MHATCKLIEELRGAKDYGEHPLAAFVDVPKAFDSISPSIPVKKLRGYGFNDITCSFGF